MCIAERHISHRNSTASDLFPGLRNLDALVRQRRTAYRLQNLISQCQPVLNTQPFANTQKSLLFTLLCALAIADMQSSGDSIPCGQSSAYAGVHPTAQQHYGFDVTGHATFIIAVISRAAQRSD